MKKNFIGTGLCFAALFATFATVGAKGASLSDSDLKAYLQEFHKNPEKAMMMDRPKWDLNGNPVETVSPFTKEQIEDGSYMNAHLESRNKLCTVIKGERVCIKDIVEGKAAVEQSDVEALQSLLETSNYLKTPGEIEKAGLLKAQMEGRLPWSESYWPILQGVVANRYADGSFPHSNDWAANHDFVLAHPASAIFAAGGDGDSLSPAEKYDFLVGDGGFTLTAAMWNKGKRKVSGWEGICDGWSAAALMVEEPIHSIYATSASGKKVHFYPSDMRGLASILWSAATPTVRFMGNKCQVGGPVRDPIGRIKAKDCWDVNPGIFHMAAINQIGVNKRGFIEDGVYDIEIWNYPTWMYEFKYFNPQTLMPSNHWKDAVVPADRFYIDKFKSYRNPATKFVLGISMNVTYMVELQPTHMEGRHQASAKTVNYIYDLELDGNYQIIGGEWYSYNHPDFVWAPPRGSRAMSLGDSHLVGEPLWNGLDVIPTSYTQVAPLSSGNEQPLAVVIEQLVNMAK